MNHQWVGKCKDEQNSVKTYLSILDLIIVHVLRAWGVLSNVLSLGELGVELLAAVPAVGLGETELRLRLLNGQWQFTE